MRIRVQAYVLFCICGFFTSCATTRTLQNQDGFVYQEIKVNPFNIASMVKIQKVGQPLRIYIEGDGFAWVNSFSPSSNPTPKNDFVLNIAKSDPYPNVVYLARPCQFVSSKICEKKYWTTARFSKEVVEAMIKAVRLLENQYKAPTIQLVGYSGGGTIASLLAVRMPEVTEFATIAGVLDHHAWTTYHADTPLSDSLNPASDKAQLAKKKQTHFVGEHDKTAPPQLATDFISSYPNRDAKIIVIKNADHSQGWNGIETLLFK